MDSVLTFIEKYRVNERLESGSASNSFYYIAFALYLVYCLLGHTTVEAILFIPVEVIRELLLIAALLLLLAKYLYQRVSFSGLLVAALLTLVGFIGWRCAREGWLFWLVLFVVCGKDVDLRRLAQIALVVSLAGVVVVVLASAGGAIRDIITNRSGHERHAMGFSHANTFGLYLLMCCMSFSVLRFGNKPLPDAAVLAVAALLILLIADSRTTVLLALVQAVLLFVFYCVRSEQNRELARRIFVVLIVLILLSSLYFMLFYDAANPIHSGLDSLLSGRLRLANSYYKMGSITLFGNSYAAYDPISWDTDGAPLQFLVDNAYCHLLLRYGVIPFVLFVAGYGLMLHKLVKQKSWDALLFGLVLMAIYGFSEVPGIRVEYNYFLTMMAPLLLYAGSSTREGKAVGTVRLARLVRPIDLCETALSAVKARIKSV